MAYMQDYIILCLVGLVSAVVIRAVFAKRRTKLRLPPGPPALPIIGHLHLLGSLPHRAFYKLANRYGPLIHLSLGSRPCVVASTPEVAREFLKTREALFVNRPKFINNDYLSYGSSNILFAPCGPYWKFAKKICTNNVLGGRTLDQFLPIRREEIARFMHMLRRKAEAKEAVEVGREVTRLTNNVITRMSIGQRYCGTENEIDDVRKVVREIAGLNGKFNVSDYIWFCKNLDLQGFGKRLREVRAKVDVIMEGIIKEHEEARNGEGKRDCDVVVKDVVDILLDIAEDESSEIRLTKENIKAFILDLFMAGTDTSAITMEWALAELINHPNIMNKAREEIEAVVGKTRLVEESDIPNLPYLQAIVKETLRLHPPAPMNRRESSEKCIVNGYEIPEKTILFVNVWAIGRDPRHWEDPLEFKPERFLGQEGSGISHLDVKGQQFHFLSFGSGRRGCPGTSLAMQVIQTSLAAMVQCFEWRVETKNGLVGMEEGPSLVLIRAQPLVCVPVARFSPLPV